MANFAIEDQDQQINGLGKCNAETKNHAKRGYTESLKINENLENLRNIKKNKFNQQTKI